MPKPYPTPVVGSAIACFLFFLCSGLRGGAQTTLTSLLDASATANRSANYDEFYIVQPSRHGAVALQLLFAGDPGWIGLPIVSLAGDYTKSNANAGEVFCSLDEALHLVWPNPALATITTALSVFPPFPSTAPIPFGGPVLVSGPTFAERAFYIQLAELLANPLSPVGYDFQFSKGLTIVQTEAQGAELSTAPSFTAAKRGSAMASGDLNGDGVDDLVVGAPGDSALSIAGAGRVYIYLGRQRTPTFSGGLHPIPYVLEEPNLTSVLFGENPGPEANAHFGSALALGDVDADGRDELVVSVPDGDGVANEPNQGEVYVFTALELAFGPGLPQAPTFLNVSPSTVVQVRPVIEKADARFGYRVVVGDVTGDQVADVVASAPFYDIAPNAELEAGRVYVFTGPITPAAPFQNELHVISDTVVGSFEHFGASLALGKVSDEGLLDVIVGVPGQAVFGIAGAGKIEAYTMDPIAVEPVGTVLHPTPTVQASFGLSASAGDLNGDGRDDLIIGSDDSVLGALNAGTIHLFKRTVGSAFAYEPITSQAPTSFERFGREILVQDFNADGLADIAVGSPGSLVSNQSYAGKAFVYFGRPNSLAPASMNQNFRQLHLRAETPGPYQLFGFALAAGDFAGVGVQDLAIGEPLAPNQNQPTSGQVHLFTDLLHRKNNPTLTELQ